LLIAQALNDLMILFLGDYAPEKKRFLSKRFKKLLNKVNYVVINYEGTSSEISTKNFKKKKNGYIPLVNNNLILELLHLGKKVICNLSNNHSDDYGLDGYSFTIKNLRKIGCKVIGPINKKLKILPFIKLSIDDWNVVLISASEPISNELSIQDYKFRRWRHSDALKEVKNFSNKNTTKIFYFHAGVEFINIPNPSLVKKMNKVIDSGFDYAFAHHQHVSLPIIKREKNLIAYGLGNMAFDCPAHKFHTNTDKGISILLNKNIEKHKVYDVFDNGNQIDLLETKINFFKNDKLPSSSISNEIWSKVAFKRLFNKDLKRNIQIKYKSNQNNKNFLKILKKIFTLSSYIKVIRLLKNQSGRDVIFGSIYYYFKNFFFKTI
tara:strand:+ start:17231 stop:18364 length:1134 start_codon:yes stop_codon:yes gene_type:complete